MTDYAPFSQGEYTPRPINCPICGLTENWASVSGYSGLYQISNIGRVRSLGVRRRCGYGKTRFINGRQLGGNRIALSRPGDQRYVVREVLFLEHFSRTPPGSAVTYLDGDRSHLCVGNIGWEFPALGYRSMHRKITAVRGPASKQACVGCPAQAQEWSYTKSGFREVESEWGGYQVRYSLDPAEYLPRCKKCHRNLDGWWLKPRAVA